VSKYVGILNVVCPRCVGLCNHLKSYNESEKRIKELEEALLEAAGNVGVVYGVSVQERRNWRIKYHKIAKGEDK